MKLKKGDEVIITSGKDKGKKGKIEKVFRKSNTVLLPGLNVFKRHMKKRDENNPGGIIDFPRPVKVANVALICPKCGKPTRIGYKVQGDTKSRICRKCDSIL
ncbi:50S ribosomal protein L24 [Patescibacteria group bacterium]|nr:50S ribosomal protein L24 [Patescibacteria group bacterium]MCL5797252.1 50S ribosomal protein L24 [Patescibacteria group bacterium]